MNGAEFRDILGIGQMEAFAPYRDDSGPVSCRNSPLKMPFSSAFEWFAVLRAV